MEELLDAIAKLAQKIATSNTEEKVSLLPQALEYGELGIDLLIECLEDAELKVRATAYQLLHNVESEKARSAIAPGFLLNPGDKIYIEELSLSSEEAEINLLLTALNDSQLEIRSLAYRLLQEIDSEKAQQAIYQGMKLNPGDQIYSVYQAGMGFDDVMYYLVEDYVDYDHQLHILAGIDCNCDHRDYAKRKYCYTNKTQAEIAAETLHRQLIKEENVYLEWRRENPNFDLKKWCIDRNITYKDEWEQYELYDPCNYGAILEIKELIAEDEQLIDSFRRSRYLCHPKYIDTWCKDNDIPYEQICDGTDSKPWNDYWDNYNKIFEYLDLPENIELISKFWKDGIGHMAFVKEEIVQQTAYVKIGKKLNRELGEDKIFAVPKEFELEAAKLLVEIIDSKNLERETSSKARKMLQENDWDEIPF